MSDTSTPVVQASGITKRFGPTVALRDADLVVHPGRTHALLGRNGAGKSTLVSIITGVASADAGTLTFSGRPAPAAHDLAGWQREVACVYQKSTIIPDLSVAENLFINRQDEVSGGRRISWNALHRAATEVLERYEVRVDPRTPASSLNVEQRQMVEIARALSRGTSFMILDEPTAQLDGPAIERLFGHIRRFQEQGVTFLYISHHLQEVFEVCQDVTVFRDATRVLESPVTDVTERGLVEAMTGDAEALVTDWIRPPRETAPPALTVSGLEMRGVLDSIDLTVAPGEVVGVAGSGSSGKVQLAESIVGLRSRERGEVTVGGTTVARNNVPAAIAAGLGFVPEDRHREGFVPDLSIAENVTMTISHRLGRFGYVSSAARRAHARQAIADLAIATSGPDQPVRDLSGGNAQKVVMARALASASSVLVLIDPTAGVDVRSKESLLGIVDSVAREGVGVLLVSDELDDLRVADRVLVMVHGRITQELTQGWTDRDMVAATEGFDPASVSDTGPLHPERTPTA